jgi:aspartate racemase
MTDQNQQPTASRTIGLIGGLAFRAGVFYYDQLLRRHTELDQRLSLVLGHADVNTVLACIGSGDKVGLGNYLGSIANQLFDAGAEFVAITAVAPHLAIDEISRVAQGPVVNVLESIPAGLEAARIGRVAIFGNRAVMETDAFGTIPERMVVRLEPSVLNEVHAIYNDIALHGKRGTRREVEFLENVARAVIGNGKAQAVLLAGTDLSSFYSEQPPLYRFLDVARLHIDEIMRRAQAA